MKHLSNWFHDLKSCRPMLCSAVQYSPYQMVSNLISLQTDNNTRSSDVVTLARQSPASSLKITDLFSFQYISPHFWNKLPVTLREPVSPLYTYLNPSFSLPLSPSITSSLFHNQLASFSALIPLVWSSDLQKSSPKWFFVSSGTY